MEVGTAIWKLRKRRNIRQNKLAALIGVGGSYLSKIENNQNQPNKELIAAIAKELEVSPIILAWMGMEEKDIPEAKREIYKKLKPAIDALIEDLI